MAEINLQREALKQHRRALQESLAVMEADGDRKRHAVRFQRCSYLVETAVNLPLCRHVPILDRHLQIKLVREDTEKLKQQHTQATAEMQQRTVSRTGQAWVSW